MHSSAIRMQAIVGKSPPINPKDFSMMFDHSNRIPVHIQEMKGYVPGKTIEEVQKIYRPAMIAKLASNENRLGCSPRVREAVLESLSAVQNYPDPLSLELREELARRNGVDPASILVTAGSESAISILCRTFLQPLRVQPLRVQSIRVQSSDMQGRAEAVTAEATFVGFFVQAGVMNAKVTRVPMAEGYRFDGRAMLDAIRDETRMIYLANPNNPTGTYMPADEFRVWLEGIPDHVLIVVDEAYLEYAMGVEDYPQAIEDLHSRPNMLLLRTFSKAYGLAGFRVVYVIGDPELIGQLA
ncbi:MAG: pyridoxal phosphate-dependent aminotransferase, partial [Balneolaceae bacterium]